MCNWFLELGVTLALANGIASATLTQAQRSKIDEITGAKGVYTASEDVYKVSFPRGDLRAVVDGWRMQPFMGLTSWVAFTSSGSSVMAMGDLTLAEDEVNPVMSVALDNGLEVTALHNHFFFDRPRIMFMHVGGHGELEQVAGAVRKAIDQVRAVRQQNPTPASGFPGGQPPVKSSISPAAVENALGTKGQASNGMFKVTIGRIAKAHGAEIGTQMGVNTWAAFAGSDENAFVDGDIAMHETEVQAVLKALRHSGINIVAIHNHMTGEEPRYVFLHYWGKGKAADLARAVKSALDTQSK